MSNDTLDYNSTTERFGMTCPSGVSLDIDPLGAYPDVTNGHIIESMGLLPQILSGYYGLKSTFKENADTGYVETSGGKPFWSDYLSCPTATVEDNGVYQFPGDPERSPLAVLSTELEDCFIYESGFIAVKDKDGTWLTARLD